MTGKPAAKGRRASARRSAEAAPQEDRIDRLERMIEALVQRGTVVRNAGDERPDGSRVPAPAEDEDQDDKIDRAAELAKRQEREAIEDAAAKEAIDHLIDPRHKEIFDWLRKAQGKRAAQLLKEILRSALIRERPAYRESKGGGGHSSRNIETLQERLR